MNDGQRLDREFWLIILTSWEMEYIQILEEYAQDCERSMRWR